MLNEMIQTKLRQADANTVWRFEAVIVRDGIWGLVLAALKMEEALHKCGIPG